jgi:alpha-ketoglutaric semialdehyde dehydrogenase
VSTTQWDHLQRSLTDGGFVPNFISGQWARGSVDDQIPIVNPITEETVLHFWGSSPADCAEAHAAAAESQRHWRDLNQSDRSTIVLQAASLISERAEELARTMSIESGKPQSECVGEVGRTVDLMRVLSGLAQRALGEVHPGHRPAEQWTFSTRSPLGVAVAITPWNFPMLIPAWKTVPAILMGNSVLLKPAEATPITAASFVALLADAGIPAGVVNLVLGRGQELSSALVAPPARAVSFTGGNVAGKQVATLALAHGMKYQLEMGGSNPALVLGDADEDVVVREVIAGAFGASGQRCTSTRRLFVVESIIDRVKKRIDEAMEQTSFDSNRDAPASMNFGPLISAQARQIFEEQVSAAVEDRVPVRRFGSLPAHGYFVQPTILDNPNPTATYVAQEVFGPMLSVLPVSDLRTGIAACNATAFGLSAAIFTRSIRSAIEFTREVEAGIIHVNSATTGAEPTMPFGGMKESSNFSRELGTWGLDWFTETKAVYVDG